MTKNLEIAKNLGKQARAAQSFMSCAQTKVKNAVLFEASINILKQKKKILEANNKDLLKAKEKKYEDAFIDRLRLTERSIKDMSDGIQQVIGLPDPVGSINDIKEQPSGIKVGTMCTPIGVILMIYESRPNVTVDAAALCLKAGNCVILRGGSESLQSNTALHSIFKKALYDKNIPTNAVQLVPISDRSVVKHLLGLEGFIDVIIPRGGKSLIQRVSNESRIQVIKHLDGICHVFVDKYADINMGINITVNSKVQRLGTCNTLETLLIDASISKKILPTLCKKLLEENIELRVCVKTKKVLVEKKFKEVKKIKNATNQDWETEYLDAILAIKIVEDIDEAIVHIEKYGSSHTDSIVTNNHQNAMCFLRKVDSSSVMVNASTRFADGYQYGLGAEIGISTNKLHARGPVGLEGLTTKKWIVLGDGEIRI